ncbi:MAG: hypothetical protein KC431_25940, partial [Myxococcales bacterium]|nr:hypothetical protein [Myxococcales bacterium]
PECVDPMDCMVGNCLEGSCVTVGSCKELKEADMGGTLPSGPYQIDPDGDGGMDPFMVWCDMETAGGGWTLVLKSNADSPVFHYDSPEWMSDVPYEPGNYMLDRTETKLPSYSTVAFDDVMVAMESPVGMDPDPLVLHQINFAVAGNSLFELISSDAYTMTGAGRDEWLTLVDGSALQANCNKEGFNVTGVNVGTWSHVRIGIIGNEQNDCTSPDSRLGIGGAGTACGTLDAATGNFTGCNAQNVNLLSFGLVFVR